MESSWYTIFSRSGYEEKVKKEIYNVINKKGYESYLEDVLIPKKTVTKIRNGEKKLKEEIIFPGYIFVKIKPTDNIFSLITSIDKISGFLGAGKEPIPVSQEKIDSILKDIEKENKEAVTAQIFKVNDVVKIVDNGMFYGLTGRIIDVMDDKKLKLAVAIFGRETDCYIDADNVENIE